MLPVFAHERHFGTVAIAHSSEKAEAFVLFRLHYPDIASCGIDPAYLKNELFPALIQITLNGEPVPFSSSIVEKDNDLIVTSLYTLADLDSVFVSADRLFGYFADYKIIVSVKTDATEKGVVLNLQKQSGAFEFAN